MRNASIVCNGYVWTTCRIILGRGRHWYIEDNNIFPEDKDLDLNLPWYDF